MKNQSIEKKWLVIALCLSMAVELYTIITTPMSLITGMLYGWTTVALTIVCCEVAKKRAEVKASWLVGALCLSMAAQMYMIITTPMSLFVGILNGWTMVALTIVCCEVAGTSSVKVKAQEAEYVQLKAAA